MDSRQKLQNGGPDRTWACCYGFLHKLSHSLISAFNQPRAARMKGKWSSRFQKLLRERHYLQSGCHVLSQGTDKQVCQQLWPKLDTVAIRAGTAAPSQPELLQRPGGTTVTFLVGTRETSRLLSTRGTPGHCLLSGTNSSDQPLAELQTDQSNAPCNQQASAAHCSATGSGSCCTVWWDAVARAARLVPQHTPEITRLANKFCRHIIKPWS